MKQNKNSLSPCIPINLDFIKVCQCSHGSGKKSSKSLNIKLLLSKDGKRWLLVWVIESCAIVS